MAQQFGRVVEVNIDGLDRVLRYPDLDIFFDGDFSDDGDPNFYTVTAYNLSLDTICSIKKEQPIIVNAGYKGDIGTVVAGFITKVETIDENIDKVTQIEIQDATINWYNAVISQTFTGPILASQVLENITNGLGLEIGVIELQNDILYQNGKSAYGKLSNAIKQIAENECGSKVVVRDRLLEIRIQGTGQDTGFILNKNTGLIGTPEQMDDKDSQADYRIRFNFNPRIKVRTIIQLESKVVSGTFMILRGTHNQDFITEAEIVRVEVS